MLTSNIKNPRIVAVTGSTEAIIDALELSTRLSPNVYNRYGTTVQISPKASASITYDGEEKTTDVTFGASVKKTVTTVVITDV